MLADGFHTACLAVVVGYDVGEVGVPARQSAVGEEGCDFAVHLTGHDGNDLIDGLGTHGIDRDYWWHLKLQLVTQLESHLVGLGEEHVVFGKDHGAKVTLFRQIEPSLQLLVADGIA